METAEMDTETHIHTQVSLPKYTHKLKQDVTSMLNMKYS